MAEYHYRTRQQKVSAIERLRELALSYGIGIEVSQCKICDRALPPIVGQLKSDCHVLATILANLRRSLIILHCQMPIYTKQKSRCFWFASI